MRIAIVHDWLTAYAGAERVLEQLLNIYPEADLFSVCDFLSATDRAFLKGITPTTTFIQRLPRAESHYRSYLPLMPLAVEQIDLSEYDLVISSSHAVAKGVLTGPKQLHVSYVHTPIRYAWDLQHQYLREANLRRGVKSWIARYVLHKIRQWDIRTANGVDAFVANSDFIRRRIMKCYRREADVVYPPVDLEAFAFNGVKSDYFVTASRLVPYKRVDLIVSAFTNMPSRRLVVIGDGPERGRIERIAAGRANISVLGHQPRSSLIDYMRKAKAFVFAAEEDFGITPVEAQACGTPVIAFGCGGACETVRGLDKERPTGVFFMEQTATSIVEAIELFERSPLAISALDCRANAERFSVEEFRRRFSSVISRELGFFARSGW